MSEERKSTKRISEVNFCKSEHISPSVTTFSSEQRAILRSMNFNYICKLTGQSIASLRDEGNTFSYKWHIGEAFEDEHSTLTEVAINTNSFWIIDSDRKTFAEQTAIILSYSKKINEIVPGVEAKLGKAADYAELFFTHRKIVGDMTLLVPGIGAQGGDLEATLKAGLNSKKAGLMINSSRGIIFAQNPREEAMKLRNEINKFL